MWIQGAKGLFLPFTVDLWTLFKLPLFTYTWILFWWIQYNTGPWEVVLWFPVHHKQRAVMEIFSGDIAQAGTKMGRPLSLGSWRRSAWQLKGLEPKYSEIIKEKGSFLPELVSSKVQKALWMSQAGFLCQLLWPEEWSLWPEKGCHAVGSKLVC